MAIELYKAGMFKREQLRISLSPIKDYDETNWYFLERLIGDKWVPISTTFVSQTPSVLQNDIDWLVGEQT